MKLNDVRPNIETSGDLDEQFFSIQDQGMIFDILRNKMYSNPILAICREITCNARDAHREVGTPERPIHITLPTSLEPFYKIKDFGPGISPDRMVNIFIKYTASTKRLDNVQTGGFGLGAKTPFSYSDTFTIMTVFEGIQYHYVCFIDETKVGKLGLLSTSPTTEPNSTEIIIPVKLNDQKHFIQWTEHTTRHWDVKPIITGGSIEYNSINTIIEGSGWAIIKTDSWNRETKIIIDGIEYPVDLTALKTFSNNKLTNIIRGDIYLYFGVGELSLSANREQIYLDKQTQNKINERLEVMFIAIKQNIQSKINEFPNLWLANSYYRNDLLKIFNSTNIFGTFYWQNIDLCVLNHHLSSLKCTVFTFSRGSYSRRFGSDPNKIHRNRSGNHLSFDANSQLFINDLSIKEPTVRNLKKAFDDDKSIKIIHLINFTSAATEEQLNNTIYLDKMQPRKLSEITKASSRTTSTLSSSRLLVFKFDSTANAFRHIGYNTINDDTNKKVICLLKKEYENGPKLAIFKKKIIDNEFLKVLCKNNPNYSFYGIDNSIDNAKIKEHFSNFISLESFIEKQFPDSDMDKFISIKCNEIQSHIIEYNNSDLINKYNKLIIDTNSLFMKKMILHKQIESTATKNEKMSVKIFELQHGEISQEKIDDFLRRNPHLDAKKIVSDFDEKYPLLSHISSYYKNDNDVIKAIAHYVNLVDKQGEISNV